MDGAHTHGNSGGDPTPLIAAIVVVVGGIFILPIVLAILQVVMWIAIATAGIALGGGIFYATHAIKHRHDPPRLQRAPWQTLRVNRPAARGELPAGSTHVTLTTEQYEALVRRLDRGR